MKHKITCSVCGGRGFISKEEGKEICSKCRSEGFIWVYQSSAQKTGEPRVYPDKFEDEKGVCRCCGVEIEHEDWVSRRYCSFCYLNTRITRNEFVNILSNYRGIQEQLIDLMNTYAAMLNDVKKVVEEADFLSFYEN